MNRHQARAKNNRKVQVYTGRRFPAPAQATAAVRLRFGNDEFALGCALFRQRSGMEVCRPELGKIMKFAAQAFCC